MTTLILSDLHGNIAALEAIVANEHYDEVICLGDIVGYGPEPAACVRWVRRHATLVVQGNHDHALAEGMSPECRGRFQWLADATTSIGRTQLAAEELAYLKALPQSACLIRDGVRYLFVHAAPTDPLYGYRRPNTAAWAEELATIDTDVVVVGHTHLQFELAVGNKRVVNPGSAGQPHDGDPRAAFAIIKNGAIRFDRAAYPVERTVAGLVRAGVERGAVEELAALLRTGRIPPLV
jgi:predicted phosphodiesterase